MVTDDQVRRIALFFLFTLMDEKTALQASHRVVAHLKAHSPLKATEEPVASAEIIRALRKQYDHYSKQLPRNRTSSPPEEAWSHAGELAGWTRFQKEAGETEMVAVALSKVLGFEDEAIATGLNISLGTARYRIGKGVRQLGFAVKDKA